jgi:peptide/nickel transport system ATP-binding protein
VCGWESRDLRDRFEEHWAQLPEEAYEAERAVIGELGALDKPETDVVVPAGKSAATSDVLAVLERLRTEHRDEPLWTGVKRMAAVGKGVEVEFHEPIEPRLLTVDGVQVECHLHDPESLAEAERRRAGNEKSPVEDRAL